MEARKRALAKKKKLRTLGRRARSQGSDDEEEEVDGRALDFLGYLYPKIVKGIQAAR